MSVAITGVPIACASVAVRPNASGSVEAITATRAVRKAAGHVVDVPDDADALREPGGLDRLLERCRIAAAALRVDPASTTTASPSLPRSRSSRAASISTSCPFQRGEPRSLQDHGRVRADAPLLAQLGDALWPDDRRIEVVLVDAAVDDVQARVRRAVAHADQVGGVVRVGDHRVAARHHAVVEPLRRA